MKLKYKLGDTVIFNNGEFKNIKGKIVGIDEKGIFKQPYLIYSKAFNHRFHNGNSFETSKIYFKNDNNCCWVSENKLTLCENKQSFYTEKAVIYYDNFGNKYVSKCHDEPFDLEKGVAMCLLKSKGIDYKQFKEIVKTFKNNNTFKITLKEFFASKEKLAIHCNTEEKANALLKAFDKIGERWITGNTYTEFNMWKINKEDTCYTNNGTFSDFGWYYENSIKIYKFEDVDLSR